MKWLVIVLALTVAQACDLPGAGPTLPAGAHWVSFAIVPSEGPILVREGIFAAASPAELETAAARTGQTLKQPCPTTCWHLYHAAQPGLLYVAVGTWPDGCDHDVKESGAMAGRTLYFIHWVGGSNGTRCGDAEQAPRWRLVSVSRRDLPGAGTLTVRLQLQGTEQGGAESQVELT
jgi:hypothetical protein